MRDPKRIDKIIKIVKEIWKKNPDLRLCQLISNCFLEKDLYYVEDKELIRRIKKTYIKDENNI